MVEQSRIRPSAGPSGPEPSLNLHTGLVLNPAPCGNSSFVFYDTVALLLLLAALFFF